MQPSLDILTKIHGRAVYNVNLIESNIIYSSFYTHFTKFCINLDINNIKYLDEILLLEQCLSVYIYIKYHLYIVVFTPTFQNVE